MTVLHDWWHVEFYGEPHWNRKHKFNLLYKKVKSQMINTIYEVGYQIYNLQQLIIYVGRSNKKLRSIIHLVMVMQRKNMILKNAWGYLKLGSELLIFLFLDLWWFEEKMKQIEADKSDNLYYVQKSRY